MKRKNAQTRAKQLRNKIILPAGLFNKLIETVESVHPRLLDLADHVEWVGELSPAELAKLPAERVAEFIKVPHHKGRHQDPATLRRIRVVEKYLQDGLKPSDIIRREHPNLLQKTAEFEQQRQRLRAFIRYHKLSSR